MIQLALTAMCGIGCLAALVSVISSLLASIQRSSQGKPFLALVPLPSYDGQDTCLLFGLMQVQHLAENSSVFTEVQE